MRFNCIISVLLLCMSCSCKLIMIIRHGEKFNDEESTLSDVGQARANCLVEAFGEKGTYVTPQKIFAQNNVGKTSTRPRDTVTPLAQALHLNVDLTHSSEDIKGNVNSALNAPEDIILISWSKDNLDNMAKEFGLKKVPNWESNVFDDIWILTDGNTPFIKNAPGNTIVSTKTYGGDNGFAMFVAKENVDQCIKKSVPNFTPNVSGASMLKIGVVTIMLSALSVLYLLF